MAALPRRPQAAEAATTVATTGVVAGKEAAGLRSALDRWTQQPVAAEVAVSAAEEVATTAAEAVAVAAMAEMAGRRRNGGGGDGDG